jgi:hypothetical protein
MTHINPNPYDAPRLADMDLIDSDGNPAQGWSPEDYDGPEDAARAVPDDCTYCDGTGQVVVDTGVGVVIESCSCTAGIAIRAIS